MLYSGRLFTFLVKASQSMSRLYQWVKQARNLIPAEITRGRILILCSRAFCIGPRGWKSESGEIRGCKKSSREACKRVNVIKSQGKHYKVNAVFHYLKTVGDYTAFVSLERPASAPIKIQPNGFLSGMMNRSGAYTLVPNFHFSCICLKSFLILTCTAVSEPIVALVFTVILVITALARSL